ncbi:aminoglycoside phosphotransferase family protein [Paenibacillus oralis]|uniref:Aminoglycoside phosphotransferase family protein n=1 Tax=Paenibacillus oralis TaxID=2490856 RepID=A0A3P3U4L5_9BACL|nr:aminoglycoside phosphotransferase family protein [Paenibacillus oralis]RRJ65185.1 aminoglycoside phosphotransferase family protein [Paenibacillus oralis]
MSGEKKFHERQEPTINILNINWVELEQDTLNLKTQAHKVIPLSPGLEADVVKVESGNGSYVLKIWNKSSKPHIENQHKLLSELYNRGISVSKPYGWGVDADNNQVLLTSYDGMPVSKINKNKLKNLARMLAEVHKFRLNDNDSLLIPRYDFIHYFFPSIETHEDLNRTLMNVINMTELGQNSLIHGDYNLGNIVEEQERYTIIDWTNGQLGDPRYDIAWSVFLMKIYAGERNGEIYHSEFLGLTDYRADDLRIFEAIACLRWILLNRISSLPKGPSTMKRVKKIVQNNSYLKEHL